MARTEDQRIALVSIHPVHADAILRGSKRVEFRRSVYPSKAEYVVIYATAPVKRVVGWFRIGRIAIDEPDRLWLTYQEDGAITADTFSRYFASCELGAAIEVEQAVRLPLPLNLDVLLPNSRPPQSYRYVSNGVAEAVGIPI